MRVKQFTNRRLLDLAHALNQCTGCGKYSEHGLEPAHSNQSRHGKGMSLKAHDCFHAALCHECHVWLDQGPAPREEKIAFWQDAFEQTLLIYFQNGWLAAGR
jgi:hypothetical protein